MNAPTKLNAKLNIAATPGGKGIDPRMAERYAGKTACVIGAGFGGLRGIA